MIFLGTLTLLALIIVDFYSLHSYAKFFEEKEFSKTWFSFTRTTVLLYHCTTVPPKLHIVNSPVFRIIQNVDVFYAHSVGLQTIKKVKFCVHDSCYFQIKLPKILRKNVAFDHIKNVSATLNIEPVGRY
jgi:hypothetical protein